jgi:hypothetical protein
VFDFYRATVTVTAPIRTTLFGLSAIAYTDVVASGVGFATESMTAAACANLAQNRSVACSLGSLVAPATWVFELLVDTPQYYKRDIAVKLHLYAHDARASEQTITMARLAGRGDATYAPAPGTTVDETTGDGSGMSAATALKGIFSLNQGCGGMKLPILVITVVLFLVLLLVRCVVMLVKRDTHDDVATRDVPAKQGLLPQHVWFGAARPCHRHCGPAHAFMLLTHVLAFVTIIAALVAAYPTVDDTASQLAAALFAVGMAAGLRPVLGLLFAMYHVNKDVLRAAVCDRYAPGDAALGFERPDGAIGLSAQTFTNIADVAFELGGDVVPLGAAPGKPAAYAALGEVKKRRGFAVESLRYTRAGYAVNAAAAGGLLVAAFVIMAPLCGRRLAVLERTILYAVALDAAAMQPCFVALVWLYRWLISEEKDGRAVHDLHPVDGEILPVPEDGFDGDGDGAGAAPATRYAPAKGVDSTCRSSASGDVLAGGEQGASDPHVISLGSTGDYDDDILAAFQDAQLDDDFVHPAADEPAMEQVNWRAAADNVACEAPWQAHAPVDMPWAAASSSGDGGDSMCGMLDAGDEDVGLAAIPEDDEAAADNDAPDDDDDDDDGDDGPMPRLQQEDGWGGAQAAPFAAW